MDDDGTNMTLSAFCRPPPPRDSNRFSEEGNSSIICSIDCLPIDLLFDILLLLPADFLHEKARLVCHKWHEIVHSDDIVKAQIHHSSYGLLLSSRSDIHHVYITAIQGRIQAQELIKPCIAETQSTCNGLVMEYICHDNGEYPSLLVTNPATKQKFPLPPLPIKRFDFRQTGIAYSAASMTYKLTLPYFVDPCGLQSLPQCVHLRILTAGVDKSWRNLEVGHLTDDVKPLLRGRRPLTTEGFLHWVSWTKGVLSLNVETETFTLTKIPKKCRDTDTYFYCATLSTGRYLSLLCTRDGLVWEIWEMKPEESDDSDDRWRNLLPLKIDLRPHKCKLQYYEILEPLGWVKYPQILALSYMAASNTCIFYNLDSHEIDTIELPECIRPYDRSLTHKSNLVRKF